MYVVAQTLMCGPEGLSQCCGDGVCEAVVLWSGGVWGWGCGTLTAVGLGCAGLQCCHCAVWLWSAGLWCMRLSLRGEGALVHGAVTVGVCEAVECGAVSLAPRCGAAVLRTLLFVPLFHVAKRYQPPAEPGSGCGTRLRQCW